MRKLIIYCCSGMGREISDLARCKNKTNEYWSDILFVDDVTNGHIVNGIPVFSFESIIRKYKKDEIEFIISAGEPNLRKLLYKKLEDNNLKIINLTYPGFYQSDYLEIGKGNIVHWGATITCNIKIGNGCLFNKHSVIGHDVTIGNHCFISVNVSIGGESEISDNVYIGSGAIIRDRIRIGSNSIIGMGAVVTKNVKANSVVVGNPAKFVRENLSGNVFKHTTL